MTNPQWHDEELYKKHEQLVQELRKPMADQLDQLLVDMYKEVQDNGRNDQLHVQMDKFISLLLLINDDRFAAKYLHIALSVYCLPVQPERLKTFIDFHTRYGNYINANQGKA